MPTDPTETDRTGIYVAAIALCFFVAPTLAVYSLYHWLRFGTWATITLETVVSAPQGGWIGAQRIIEWLWTTPLWGILIFIAWALVFVMERPRS